MDIKKGGNFHGFSFFHNNDNDNDDDDDDDNDDDDDDDNNDKDDDDNENNATYNIGIGNSGFVLVNQMTDYVNRGDELSYMCYYEYCSKVYKEKFKEEEKERHAKRKADPKHARGPKAERYFFSDNHPQSETHWQVRRKEPQVPSLSKLPSSSENNKEKFQKCILLLFKPFRVVTDLFNGISWDESYEATDFAENSRYVENIEEMHIGLQERNDACDDEDQNCENDDDVLDNVDEELENTVNGLPEEEIDSVTLEAVEIVKLSGWLDESTSTQPDPKPTFDATHPIPGINQWKKDIRQQNRDILNGVEPEEDNDEDLLFNSTQLPVQDDRDVGFTTDVADDIDLDDIAAEIITRFSLNRKQKYAFEMAIKNVIKRERNEETQQFIGYIGGPGGTGKSQIIKAIDAFHEEINIKGKLKKCAYTGTAAKYIGGSTTSTLFGTKSANRATLEKRFANVNTIIVDEVSMIGCVHLNRISKCLTTAKHANPDLPFGGMDIIFFGDFIQFPPVRDYPLYFGWNDHSVTAPKSKFEIEKSLGQNLWRQVNHVVLLDEQMRVTDRSYQDLLNRLREGKCTDADFEMLNRRVVGNSVEEIAPLAGNPIIVPGNKLVTSLNREFATSHSQHKTVHVSTSKDSIKKKNLPTNLIDMIKDYPSTRTSGLLRELSLYVGMPVFITDNIATELGLTNGTTGVVKSIQFNCDEDIPRGTGFNHLDNMPDCVIVEVDDVNMNPLHGLAANHVPIFPKAKSFEVKIPGRKEKIKINRKHFPLVPRFACTAHKSQGQTLTKAIIDLVIPEGNKGAVEINFSYVPLSRVRALKDLTILRPFDRSILEAPINEGCVSMMNEFTLQDECRDM